MSYSLDRLTNPNAVIWKCLHQDCYLEVRHRLEGSSQVKEVDLAGCNDRMELFLKIAGGTPGSERYLEFHATSGKVNLDGLSDTLCDGFSEGTERALFLQNADLLVEEHLNLLLTLCNTISAEYGRCRAMGTPGQFAIYLFGTEPNFVRQWVD